MGKALIFGLMDKNILESGLMENSMERVFIYQLMDPVAVEFGIKVNVSSGFQI